MMGRVTSTLLVGSIVAVTWGLAYARSKEDQVRTYWPTQNPELTRQAFEVGSDPTHSDDDSAHAGDADPKGAEVDVTPSPESR